MVCKPFPKQALVFMCLKKKSFENAVRKGETAGNEQFLFSPHSVFSSPEHKVLGVRYCDHSPSIGVRHQSVVRSDFLLYTLASTNINQSAPNLVKVYMTIRSRMSSIMGLIGPEHLELFAFELKELLYCTCLHTSNLVKICMAIRSHMSWIMGLIGLE